MNYIITAKNGSDAKYLLVDMTDEQLTEMDGVLQKNFSHYSVHTENSLNDTRTTEVDSTRGENGKSVNIVFDTVSTPVTCNFDEAITIIGKA